MAEVYKVKTVGIAGFEKVQALKRILPSSAREGRFIRSFIDEARIAVELTHRNIVQVFEFGKADGELFLAMELDRGQGGSGGRRWGKLGRARSPVPDSRRGIHHRGDRWRPRLRASQDRWLRRRARHRALRRVAVERDVVDGRLREDLGFRDRARVVLERPRAAAVAWQAALHGARADARRAADERGRRVRARHHRVGAVHRLAAVSRRRSQGDLGGGSQDGAAAHRSHESESAGGDRRRGRDRVVARAGGARDGAGSGRGLYAHGDARRVARGGGVARRARWRARRAGGVATGGDVDQRAGGGRARAAVLDGIAAIAGAVAAVDGRRSRARSRATCRSARARS